MILRKVFDTDFVFSFDNIVFTFVLVARKTIL